MAIWATIWATCDKARLVGLRPDGPAGRAAPLPVRWRGLPAVPVALRWRALCGLPTASTLARVGAMSIALR